MNTVESMSIGTVHARSSLKVHSVKYIKKMFLNNLEAETEKKRIINRLNNCILLMM